MRFKYIIIFSTILSIVSCNELILEPNPQKLVVEGWIEDDGFPVVILTKTLPVSNLEIPIDSLGNYVARWARVEVSDGNESVVLTGMQDLKSFSGYIYTTSELRGKPGKTYTLTVDYGKEHITAVTTIPEHRAYLDSILIEQAETEDSLYALSVLVSRQEPNKYFKLFVATYPNEGYYMSSLLGTFSSDDLPEEGPRRINVHRGMSDLDIYGSYSPFFKYREIALLKISAMEHTGYDFWDAYDKNLSLTRNPFFPYYQSLPFNINGGLGYWIGYASTEYKAYVE